MKARLRLWYGNLPLTARLVLNSGLVLLLCGVVLLYVVLRDEIADQHTTLSHALHDQMHLLLPALAGPAVLSDYTVIEQMLEAIAQQPIIAQLSWTDNFGHSIVISRPALRIRAPWWFVQWLALPVVEQSQSLIVGGETYGTVMLRLTSALSINRIWQAFLERIVTLLVGTVFSLGVTLVVLNNGLRPLHTLAASAWRFGHGDYTVRVPLHGSPETLQCIRAFNGMAENIASLVASLRQMVDAMPIPVLISRVTDGTILYANRHLSDMCGLPGEGFIGHTTQELYHDPADRQSLLKVLDEHGYVSHYEIRYKKIDGTPLWVMASAQTITFEREAAILSGFYDITSIKNAEEALRSMHAETVQLLDAIASILLGIDTDHRLTWWNHEADQMLGQIPAAMLGTPLARCPLPWDYAAIQAGLARCTDLGAPVQIDDVRFQRPDGKEGYLGITISPMSNAVQGKKGFLLLGADITERRTLQRQLIQAQKLEGIGQLAAGIAHEINTPTQFIGDNTRFLQDAFGDLCTLLQRYRSALQEVPAGAAGLESLRSDVENLAAELDAEYLLAEIPTAIAQSIEGVERVAGLVRAMKEFSHPSGAEQVAVDLNKAIDSTIIVARHEWRYVAEMVTDFDPTLPLVSCVPGEFNQVVLNIIVNAAHALAEVVKNGAPDKGTITVSTRWESGWAEIRIADTGAGIPEAIQSKIFDPFFTTKGVGKGTGQGLAIAHDVVVKKHGGTLTFETVKAGGTTFIIRLPLRT